MNRLKSRKIKGFSTLDKSQYESVADEIYRLRKMKQSTLTQNADRQTKCQRITEMTEFLNSQTSLIIQYDDKLIK